VLALDAFFGVSSKRCWQRDMYAILCSCYADKWELSVMELRQVRYFVGVAETLSFRQASKHLYVSQPSLSVQIKQLEDELGVSLLRRSKRGVEITRAGEAFLPGAREILLKLKQASAAAQHAENGEAGTVRLGFIPTAGFHILPRLLDKIRGSLPLVNVELREGPEAPQILGIQSGAFDISIGHLAGCGKIDPRAVFLSVSRH